MTSMVRSTRESIPAYELSTHKHSAVKKRRLIIAENKTLQSSSTVLGAALLKRTRVTDGKTRALCTRTGAHSGLRNQLVMSKRGSVCRPVIGLARSTQKLHAIAVNPRNETWVHILGCDIAERRAHSSAKTFRHVFACKTGTATP